MNNMVSNVICFKMKLVEFHSGNCIGSKENCALFQVPHEYLNCDHSILHLITMDYFLMGTQVLSKLGNLFLLEVVFPTRNRRGNAYEMSNALFLVPTRDSSNAGCRFFFHTLIRDRSRSSGECSRSCSPISATASITWTTTTYCRAPRIGSNRSRRLG